MQTKKAFYNISILQPCAACPEYNVSQIDSQHSATTQLFIIKFIIIVVINFMIIVPHNLLSSYHDAAVIFCIIHCSQYYLMMPRDIIVPVTRTVKE